MESETLNFNLHAQIYNKKASERVRSLFPFILPGNNQVVRELCSGSSGSEVCDDGFEDGGHFWFRMV